MEDEKRIKIILNKIEKLWNLNPRQRFFQLLFNFSQLGTRDKLGTIRDPFWYEDELLEKYLDAYIEECE